MGLFGHGGWLSKAAHTADKIITAPIHTVNHIIDHTMGYDPENPENNGDSWYIGYNSNGGPIVVTGPQADQIMANKGISGPRYRYNNIQKNPNTYTGNAAKTANSIKQGGMTKDDLITYNKKHPNETAETNGSMKTSLNSNTAAKGY